uniref:Armadillo repeat-containing domain-containing protein n=1 Tax=Oryza glumipatula TaxID=40148 RepID=A0A0D9Z9B1_9ORYZ
MESDASTSPRRSDSSDSSTCSDGDDLLSSSSPKGTGIHRLPPLPCATDGAIAALVEELESPASSLDDLRRAAMELRLLAKHSPDNRLRIVAAGALPPLVALLSRPDPLLQEHGVTALLNLSLREDNRGAVVDAGAVGPLSGGARGKKDAATALYALCSGAPEENGPRAVEAGAVRALLELMGEPERGMVEKAAYVLHALVGTAEGRAAAVAEGGVPVLVEMVEGGTPRHKEMATLCLLHVCEDSAAYRTMVAREGAIPPLVALSHSSDARPKLRAKAEVLVGLLRQPRSGSLLRARPSVAASRLPAGLCN